MLIILLWLSTSATLVEVTVPPSYPATCIIIIIIIIIIGSRRQQRSVASTRNAHDGQPWTIRRGCRRGIAADLLHPRVAQAAWPSAPAGVEAGTGSRRRDLGQCTMSRSVIAKSHHMTER